MKKLLSALFVYTVSQVQICACTRICIWRMYIIELLSEIVYKVYESSRSQPTRFVYGEPSADWRLHKVLHLVKGRCYRSTGTEKKLVILVLMASKNNTILFNVL